MSRLGDEDEGHVEDLVEAIDSATRTLQSIGDAPTCKEKYARLLAAQDLVSEALTHSGSIQASFDPYSDEELYDRLERVREHLEKVRDAFERECVRE